MKDVFNMTIEECEAMVKAYKLKHPDRAEVLDTFTQEICTRTTPQIDALLKSTLRDAYAELADAR